MFTDFNNIDLHYFVINYNFFFICNNNLTQFIYLIFR